MGLFQELRVRRLKRRVVGLEFARQRAEDLGDDLNEAMISAQIEMATQIIEDRVKPQRNPAMENIWDCPVPPNYETYTEKN